MTINECLDINFSNERLFIYFMNESLNIDFIHESLGQNYTLREQKAMVFDIFINC